VSGSSDCGSVGVHCTTAHNKMLRVSCGCNEQVTSCRVGESAGARGRVHVAVGGSVHISSSHVPVGGLGRGMREWLVRVGGP